MSAASKSNRHGPSLASLIVLPLLVGAIMATITLKLLWHDEPRIYMPLPGGTLTQHLSHLAAGLISVLTRGHFGSGPWFAYLDWLGRIDSPVRWALYARFVLAGIGGAGSAILTLLWLRATAGGDKPRRGRPLRRGAGVTAMLAKEAAKEWNAKRESAGIHLHPDVAIGEDRETKHFMVMGSSGSGKTHIIWQLLNEAIKRKDRIVIFDSKGDFTSELASFCLIAPWDARSRVWDVAHDCTCDLDADELATRMIPGNDKDPVWSNASREVLKALIMHLQDVKSGTWTFADLRTLLNLPIEDLRLVALQYNPEAQRSLEEGSKTTQSILINLLAFTTPVVNLAKAWGDSEAKRFSMRRWINGSDKTLPRTVVLQGSQRFAKTTATLVNSLVSVLAASLVDPSRPDGAGRVWLFLDELAQLGQLTDIGPLIRMGRSKGLRIVIGVQDIAELRDLYGTHKIDGWTSSFTTSIYTRLEGGSTAEWLSRRIGEQETEEVHTSKTQANSGTSETAQTTIRRSPTVLPSELKTLVGTRSDGVDALIDGFDDAIYLVKYPYHQKKVRRDGSRPASWVERNPAAQANQTEDAAQAVGSPAESHTAPPAANDETYSPPGSPTTGRTEQSAEQPTAQAVGSPQRAKRWTKRSPSANDTAGENP